MAEVRQNAKLSSPVRAGLRAKLIRVYALQVLLISLAALFGVFMTYVIVANVLTRQALATEAEYFWAAVDKDPAHPLPDVRNMVGYLATGRDYSQVPEGLRDLPEGFGTATDYANGPLVYVSKRGEDTLFLVFAEAQVADLVFYFGLAPLAAVLLTVYVLLFLTYRLSHRAISPMLRLAQSLEEVDFSSNTRFEINLESEDLDRETRLMVEALQNFNIRLDQFIERERTFTRDAGHELRTPIAIIKGSLNLLERQTDRPQQEWENLRRMHKALSDMETLLETLLMLAREENVLEPGPTTSVNQVVIEELEKLRELADQNDNRISIVEDCEAYSNAKPRVLAIIVSNLLRNAFTYTQSGKVTVQISAEWLAVSDTGIGMSAADRDQAFTAFYRAEQTKHRVSGQGLGLALVRRLTDQLGWQVELDSTPGVGTTIRVWFGGNPPS